MKKHWVVLILAIVSMSMLAACAPRQVVQVDKPKDSNGEIGVRIQVYAPGPNPLVNTPDAHGRPAGFWLGLWHGIISPITLIVALVSGASAQMYEVHNVGTLYNLGFFLGILVMPAVMGIVFGFGR